MILLTNILFSFLLLLFHLFLCLRIRNSLEIFSLLFSCVLKLTQANPMDRTIVNLFLYIASSIYTDIRFVKLKSQMFESIVTLHFNLVSVFLKHSKPRKWFTFMYIQHTQAHAIHSEFGKFYSIRLKYLFRIFYIFDSIRFICLSQNFCCVCVLFFLLPPHVSNSHIHTYQKNGFCLLHYVNHK